jgi:hypothetical protein
MWLVIGIYLAFHLYDVILAQRFLRKKVFLFQSHLETALAQRPDVPELQELRNLFKVLFLDNP